MTSPISAHSVERVFDGDGEPVHSLRGVNLEIQPGELVAVMGASGSGKSSLLHILAGLDRPTAGEVRLLGERIDNKSEAELAKLRRRHIGVVFQSFNLISNLTVADNVELPALVAGMSQGEARRRRNELLEKLGIGEKANVAPSKLSGGQQQRVAVARALINRPTVLLADEPTGNLDTRTTRDVLNLLLACNSEGQAIALVTHDSRVASTASRVLTLSDGVISRETPLAPGRDPSEALAHVMRVEA
ncbi:MAG: ABC transporter ATP-binding protein [Dehalococcoidia bacterium]